MTLSTNNAISIFFCDLCLRPVRSAGRGARRHTPAVRGVAGPRCARRPLRFPALRQLGEGEEERRRAVNGALQVTRGLIERRQRALLCHPSAK